MYPCAICVQNYYMDDADIILDNGKCICLACYLRNTDQEPTRTNRTLRRWFEAVLREVPDGITRFPNEYVDRYYFIDPYEENWSTRKK